MSNKSHISEKPRPIDWLCTPVFVIVFFANLCAFEVLFRFSISFPKLLNYEIVFRAFNRLIVWNLRLSTATRFSCKGKSLEINLPVVVISNHQSMFDIPFLCLGLPSLCLRFVAKTELAQGIPGISVALRNGEHAIIDRANADQALSEMERAAKLSVQKGFSLVVFPEGTRSRNGSLRQFKTGGVAKILETLGEAVILPVAIKGSWRLARFSFKPISVGNRVEVVVTEGIHFGAGGDPEACLVRAREQIQEELDS